jgi:cytochrome c556
MIFKNKMIVAAALLGIGATAVWAGVNDDAIKARQACMKANGASMGVYVPIAKGEKEYDAAAIAAAVAATGEACAKWGESFPAGSEKGETLETWAMAEAFTDKAGFEAAGGAYYQAFVKVKASTDKASFMSAFGELGGSCKACHEKYRRPKQ